MDVNTYPQSDIFLSKWGRDETLPMSRLPLSGIRMGGDVDGLFAVLTPSASNPIPPAFDDILYVPLAKFPREGYIVFACTSFGDDTFSYDLGVYGSVVVAETIDDAENDIVQEVLTTLAPNDPNSCSFDTDNCPTYVKKDSILFLRREVNIGDPAVTSGTLFVTCLYLRS